MKWDGGGIGSGSARGRSRRCGGLVGIKLRRLLGLLTRGIVR